VALLLKNLLALTSLQPFLAATFDFPTFFHPGRTTFSQLGCFWVGINYTQLWRKAYIVDWGAVVTPISYAGTILSTLYYGNNKHRTMIKRVLNPYIPSRGSHSWENWIHVTIGIISVAGLGGFKVSTNIPHTSN